MLGLFLLVLWSTNPTNWSELVGALSIPAVSISLSYFGGASIHTTIAYTTIRREADRSRSEYKAIIRNEILPPAIAELKESFKAELSTLGPSEELKTQLAELRTRLDELDVGAALEAFLASDAGREWTGELASAAGGTAADSMAQQLQSKAGAAARTAQSRIESLLEGSVQFDNPLLDGLWAAAPKADKRRAISRLARILRKAGVFVPEGDVVAGELVEDGDAPVLADPGSIDWPPRG